MAKLICYLCSREKGDAEQWWTVPTSDDGGIIACNDCILRVVERSVATLAQGCFAPEGMPPDLSKIEDAAPKPPEEVDLYVWRKLDGGLAFAPSKPNVEKVGDCLDISEPQSSFFIPTQWTGRPEVKNTVWHFKARLLGTMVPRSQIVWHEEVK